MTFSQVKWFSAAGLLFVLVLGQMLIPLPIADPGPLPLDPAREDLSRIDYPSQAPIDWYPLFIRPNDSLYSLFGSDWVLVARFNRIDRRHIYPGMTLKVPRKMAQIRSYAPLPDSYPKARHRAKYILINLSEQWLGAYEFGHLAFSMPVATGGDDHKTPTGLFRIDAHHRNHTSSLYKTDDEKSQYPMDFALRFHIDKNDIGYWIHARDLPGRPASHGCVGIYDEEMQKRVYGYPQTPVMVEARRLYEWALGEDDLAWDFGDLTLYGGGPWVEIIGDNPTFETSPLKPFLASDQGHVAAPSRRTN